MPLSDSRIRSSKPRKKTYRLKDGEGLFLSIRPNNRKYWQFRYRFLDKEQTISLGEYPAVGILDARERRNHARRCLSKGINPVSKKKKEKLLAVFNDRNRFREIAEEWFEQNKNIWSTKHAHDTWRRVEKHLLPTLGNHSIQDIEALELLAVIQKIERRGTTDISHRVLQVAGAIFKYAIITGRAKHNVTIGLSSVLKAHRKKHNPSLSKREIPSFLDALEKLNTSEQNRIAFRLLLLTGMRTGELRYSLWQEIDWNAREWRIPAKRTKMQTEHIVPLSDQALVLLQRLNRTTGEGKWLFPSQCGYRHEVMSENTINHMIIRMGYKGRVVGHGFRAMFSTILNEHGFNRDAIERQLAHMERNRVRAAYNRAEYLDERRAMMQWWADFLDGKNPVRSVPPTRSSELPVQCQPRPNIQHVSAVYPAFGPLAWENSLH